MDTIEEGELPLLDERLRRVGQWLLVGYTVAMLLVTFVVPDQHRHDGSAPVDAAPTEIFVG